MARFEFFPLKHKVFVFNSIYVKTFNLFSSLMIQKFFCYASDTF
jgi:hypothetical protein